jgi:hypothetical protein
MSYLPIRVSHAAGFFSLLALSLISNPFSFAHIFTDTAGAKFKEVGKYTVGFLHVPAEPQPHKITILNLNIQENGSDVNSVVASLKIKDKETGNTIREFPSRSYEVADLFFSQNFSEVGDYVVTFTANVKEDLQYNDITIVADFEFHIGNIVDVNLIIIQSIIVITIIVGIIILMDKYRKKL